MADKLSEVIARLSPDVLARAAPHLAKLDTFMKRQSQRDDEIAEAVLRVLKRPNSRLARQLRNLLKEIQ